MKRRNLLGLFALCLLVGLATACSDSGSEEELGPCGTRTACMQPIDCGGDGMAEFVCASDGCCYNFADMCALAEYKDHPKCQAVDGDTEQEDTSCPADRTCCTDADCETGWTCNVDQDICECPEQYETDAEGITRCCSNNHCPAPNPNDPEDPGFVCYPEEHKCVPECKINTAQDHQCCTRGDGFSPQCPPEGNSALTECKDGFCVEPGEDAPPGWECVSDNDCNSPENCVQQFYGCVWNDGTAKDKKVCQLKTPCEAGKQACCNEAVGACTPGCYELGDYLEDTGILTCNADGKNYMLSRCSSEYEAWPSNAPVASDLYDCYEHDDEHRLPVCRSLHDHRQLQSSGSSPEKHEPRMRLGQSLQALHGKNHAGIHRESVFAAHRGREHALYRRRRCVDGRLRRRAWMLW